MIEVEFLVYYDCSVSGVIWPGSPGYQAPRPHFASDTHCIAPTRLAWNQVLATEVTPICLAAVSGCNTLGVPQGSGGINGTLEVVHRMRYDFSSANCTHYTPQWSHCCRSQSITSLASSIHVFMEGPAIDLSVSPCNNSPRFLHKPVTYLCAGRPHLLNYRAYDPDGDSLVYTLVSCKSDTINSVVYNPGFSAAQPFGPNWHARLDSVSGELELSPRPGGPEVVMLCVQVEEFRNGLSLGKSVMDIQIFIESCPGNNQPSIDSLIVTIGASNRGTYHLDACVGEPLAFNLSVSEPDIHDTLIVEIDTTTVPGMSINSFGTNPRLLFFSWTPPAAGRYFLTVRGSDDRSPLPGIALRTVMIEVSQLCVDAAISYTSCDSSNGAIDLTTRGGSPPYQYFWNTGDSTEDLSNLTPGSYQVHITDQQGFRALRSYTLFGPDLELNPAIIQPSCNDSGAISLNVSGGSPPYSYRWNTGDTSAHLHGVQGNTGYSVLVTDANGCPRSGAWRIPSPDSCFNVVEGYAYLDTNGNCQRDSGEQAIPNVWVHLDSLSVATMTDSTGRYSFELYQSGLQLLSIGSD